MLNDTASKLKAFRTTLSKLPDDPTLLTESVESEVSSLIEQYEAFSSYQVSELTPAEIAKYAVIKAAVEQGLGEAKQYSLSLKVEADSEEAKTAIADMISWLQTNNTNKSKSSVSGGNSMDIADLYESGATDNNKIYEFAQMDATNTLKSTNAAESDPLDNITFLYDVGYFAYMHVRDSADHRITRRWMGNQR